MGGKQKILVILGPTSSGKSALGVELARIFGGEIISADSRQVYKGLDIGTGKVTKKEMEGVPHHLLDVVSSKESFTAKDYVDAARAAIEEVASRGKVPIVVGGTGFYIDALVGRISLPDVPPNTALRAALEKKAPAQLFALLQKKDPRRARSIDKHNKRRLVRALEIAEALGKNPRPRATTPYEVLWIGIAPEEEALHKKISERLLARVKRGMVAEGRRLREAGLSYKRMTELGLEYRALARYLRGELTRDQMVWELEREIWHYADRQHTYWKRNAAIEWFEPRQKGAIEKRVRRWLRPTPA